MSKKIAANAAKYFQFGIDTIQVNSTTDLNITPSECCFLSVAPTATSGKNRMYQYRLNPDKARGQRITCYSDFVQAYDFMIKTLGLENPQIVRVDYRLDSSYYTYEDLFPYGKALILLLAMVYDTKKNVFETHNPLTLERKTIVNLNQRFEAEYYNKAEQKPKGGINCRLELRAKKLYDTDLEAMTGFKQWVKRLEKIATPANIMTLQSESNKYLTRKYFEEMEVEQAGGKQYAKYFLHKYKDNLFTDNQLFKFLDDVGMFPSDEKIIKFIKNFHREFKGIRPTDFKSLQNLINIFCKLGGRYFST